MYLKVGMQAKWGLTQVGHFSYVSSAWKVSRLVEMFHIVEMFHLILATLSDIVQAGIFVAESERYIKLNAN